MNRVRLLPEQVANQIAAGEVVERPASVVKELVENALDAQAGRIVVEIQAGGRSLIRVTDDGVGMSRDDALLCFERHATSKIQRAEDLFAIATMGFRGEAMPSIASVSRLSLTTRERGADNPEATQVIIHGGKVVDVRSASGPPGTCVEVRQLFFNLPVRRKFLRSDETERAHIHHYLLLAALAFPQVGFTFSHDGRLVWELPAVPGGQDASARLAALRERMRSLYGGDLALLPVAHETALPDAPAPGEAEADPDALHDAGHTLRVWGLIGAPGVSRATREDQHIFVNRRPVENRGINFALFEGYHTTLMKGRYPVCCLFLDLDPAGVDVNIHPAKREVKFRAERHIRAAVAQAVRLALMNFHRTQPETAPARPSPTPEAIAPAPEATSAELPGLEVPHRLPELEGLRPASPLPAPARPPAPAVPVPGLAPVPSPASRLPLPGPTVPPPAALPTLAGPVPLLQVPLKLVGVVGKLYVVFESDRGLVLLDQHAAHERVLFEQMLRQLEAGQAPCQRLLLPETVELPPRDAVFLREHLGTLTRLGVSLSEFGERTFLLDGLPPFVSAPDARRFVLELVDELKASGQEVNSMRLGEHVVAKTVCRHAVKAHDPLSAGELERLVLQLRQCDMPYTCPHGRPTLVEMNWRELEKKFGRTQ